MTSEREFGRLEGKVDETIRRVSNVERAIVDLGRSGTAEHAEVGRKLDDLGREFRDSLQLRDTRIDSLEATRDKWSAGKSVLVGVGGAGLTLFGVLIGHV